MKERPTIPEPTALEKELLGDLAYPIITAAAMPEFHRQKVEWEIEIVNLRELGKNKKKPIDNPPRRVVR